MWVLLLNIHDDLVEPFDDFEDDYNVDIEDCTITYLLNINDADGDSVICDDGMTHYDTTIVNAMKGEAAFFYGVNLMLFSTISLPLLFAGITKKNLKVSALSVLTVFFIFMAMFSISSDEESFFSLIAMAWVAIPMSYYVWMSPWPEEVTTTEAF
jgi:hypothetical protein